MMSVGTSALCLDFMVQFGMQRQSGNPSPKEWDRNIRDDAVKQSNVRGFVTFATSGPHSRTTQIFINFSDNSRLDSMGFAPFGRVTEGMEHVDAINPEYGESPDQGRITNSGNTYLQQSFPNLDFVKKMSIVSETAE
jgi:peptidyl-prolyl cis-trans isomerase A (cyclophilin A)